MSARVLRLWVVLAGLGAVLYAAVAGTGAAYLEAGVVCLGFTVVLLYLDQLR